MIVIVEVGLVFLFRKKVTTVLNTRLVISILAYSIEFHYYFVFKRAKFVNIPFFSPAALVVGFELPEDGVNKHRNA